jgi:hypothetical protein
MGLQHGERGTLLGLNVLDGFVKVGVDRDRYRPNSNGYKRRPTDVFVNVG